MPHDLSRSTALITGSARGIGLELSHQLVSKGCSVIAVGRDEQALQRLQAHYPEAVKTIVADLALPSDVDGLIARVTAEHPEIDILINNAAIQTEMDAFSDDPEGLSKLARREISVNLSAPIALIFGLLPVLKMHKQASIVNMSSGLAIAPKAASPVYCATKAALRSATKALRYQCAEHAPHVNICEVVMALVDTDMTQGRGAGKISAKQAAVEVIAGMQRHRGEIWIAKAKLLPVLFRISPRLVARIMR